LHRVRSRLVLDVQHVELQPPGRIGDHAPADVCPAGRWAQLSRRTGD
jgi:hypothetical protein